MSGLGVIFVIDRVMHYHAATFGAIDRELASRGIPFCVVSAQDDINSVGRVALRSKVVDDHRNFRLTELKLGRFILRYQRELLSLCAAFNPAVMVSTCHSGTISEWRLLYWARRAGIRRVAWQCGYEYNPTAVKRFFLRRFIPLFDFHLCYHPNAEKYAIAYGARKSQALVMHNTIDESRIVPGDKVRAKASLASMWPSLEGKKIVLYVGAVLEEKRLDQVFEALALRADSSTVFVLVGDGPYLPVLKERYGNRDDWVSTGSVVSGVGVYFDAADVFVLPGTGGLAINEAMAHRTAVISGYADGSADDLVVDGVTGYRLRTDDVKELAERLNTLLANPELARQMGLEGEQRIRGHMSFASFIDRVVTVLAEQHALACQQR
jgi:glycosyltransferase involved in cell wall biosynthesis